MPRRMTGVEAAVERDLASFPADIAGSALAAMALAMAREIDGPNSATSKSMCARALQDVLGELRALAPAEEESDAVNDIEAQRAKRIAGSSRTADRSRP